MEGFRNGLGLLEDGGFDLYNKRGLELDRRIGLFGKRLLIYHVDLSIGQ